MDQCTKDWIDVLAKGFTVIGVGFVALNYWNLARTKRAEWLKSLFEKFYEKNDFKDVRKWIESGEVENKINLDDTSVSTDEEKIADYLNFFEFIATLNSYGQLKNKDVFNLFDYYLKKIKKSPKCINWIERKDFGFEKLRNLLNNIK